MGIGEPLPADTRVVPEEAYKFGVGPILVHSIQVITEVVFDNELWLHVTAQVANGDRERHGGFIGRELYIVAALLREQSRRNASGRLR